MKSIKAKWILAKWILANLILASIVVLLSGCVITGSVRYEVQDGPELQVDFSNGVNYGQRNQR